MGGIIFIQQEENDPNLYRNRPISDTSQEQQTLPELGDEVLPARRRQRPPLLPVRILLLRTLVPAGPVGDPGAVVGPVRVSADRFDP